MIVALGRTRPRWCSAGAPLVACSFLAVGLSCCADRADGPRQRAEPACPPQHRDLERGHAPPPAELLPVPKLPTKVSPFMRRLHDDCEAGKMAACIELARRLLEGKGAPNDARIAAERLDRACRAKQYPACSMLAQLHADGYGVPQDPIKAVALWGRHCNDEDRRSCGALGSSLLDGREVPHDPVRGETVLEAACEAGDAYSCEALALAHGFGHSLPEDPSKAEPLLARAAKLFAQPCRDGDVSSCRGLRRLRHGSEKDEADALLRKAAAAACAAEIPRYCDQVTAGGPELKRSQQRCADGDLGACSGWSEPFGEAPPSSFELHAKYCLEGSVPAACALLESSHDRGKLNVWKAACEHGELGACGLYVQGDPRLGDEGVTSRRAFACAQGHAVQCAKQAEAEEAASTAAADRSRFVALYEQACPPYGYRRDGQERSGRACLLAADSYRGGLGVKRDPALAAELYTRACAIASASPRESPTSRACVALADMLDRGEGVPQDRIRATSIYIDASRLGNVVRRRMETGVGIYPPFRPKELNP